MRVSRIISQVDVVGRLWMPNCVAANTYPLTRYDIENIRDYGDGTIDRDAIARWVDTHTGDFSQVLDFRATIGDGDFDCDFATEDGEAQFYDCMDPEE